MSENIEVTFICERCEAKTMVKRDGFSDFMKHDVSKRLAGYDYMYDTVLSVKCSGGEVGISSRLSEEDNKRADVKLLCPACIGRYEDMIKDIVEKANERVKSFLENKDG